jgi:CHASE2 domain-containing sensor protein
MTPPGRRVEGWKWLGTALASTVAQVLLLRVIGPTDASPWLEAAVLLPLAAAVWWLGRPLVRDRRALLGGGFLAFFVAYCLLFALAAGTDLLAGPRTELRGYEDDVPRNWLGLGRLGDWRYALTPKAPPANDLLVVTVEPLAGMTREQARLGFARLIAQAVERRAQGIAFDFYLEQESAVDGFLCRQIDDAAAHGVPVLFGYRYAVGEDGRVDRVAPPASLDCLTLDRLGSLAGYREADGRVRMVPLYLRGDPGLESLGLVAARRLVDGGDLALPATRLVRFLPPSRGPDALTGWPTGEATEPFRDRFIFVGAAGADVHATPFDEAAPGVLIHAWTAHALRTGAYLRRMPAGWTLVALFAAFYLLTVLQARGAGRRGLLLGAALLSAGFLGSAAAAAWLARTWIDVSYAWVGLWTLTGLLWGGARLQRGRLRADRAAAAAAQAPAAAPRDVFLSHNSLDKPGVRALADALEARGLTVWLDERELAPGRPWQEGLEEVIRTVRSALVILGPSGLGPWEIAEMRACLSEGVDRDLPIVPVLLPGAPQKPDLPLFLRRYTWVDLRGGLTEAGIDRLEWGITGVKPRKVA